MRKILFILLFLPSIVHANEFYLMHRPWNSKDNLWDLPPSAISCLDFETIPQMTQVGGVQQGWSVCSFSDPISDKNAIDLGSDLDGNTASLLSLNIGTPLTAITLRDGLWELMTQHADTHGQTSWMPLLPGKDLKMELKIAGQLIQSKTINDQSIEWPQFLTMVQEQYRTITGGITIGKYQVGDNQKQLSIWKEDYGIADPTIFIPSDLPKVQPIPHNTTYKENWNCANSASLTCQQTWADDVAGWQIVNNQAATQNTAGSFASYITSGLSSNNVLVQATVVTLNGVSGVATSNGVSFRHTASAITFYFIALIKDTDDVKKMDCQRVVAGVPTRITEPNLTWTVGQLIRGSAGEVGATTIRGYYNGALIVDTTDSTIDGTVTGGKDSGIFATIASGGAAGDAVLDDWIACDLTDNCVSAAFQPHTQKFMIVK